MPRASVPRAQTCACSSASQCKPRQVRGPAWSEPRRVERAPRHARPDVRAPTQGPPGGHSRALTRPGAVTVGLMGVWALSAGQQTTGSHSRSGRPTFRCPPE